MSATSQVRKASGSPFSREVFMTNQKLKSLQTYTEHILKKNKQKNQNLQNNLNSNKGVPTKKEGNHPLRQSQLSQFDRNSSASVSPKISPRDVLPAAMILQASSNSQTKLTGSNLTHTTGAKNRSLGGQQNSISTHNMSKQAQNTLRQLQQTLHNNNQGNTSSKGKSQSISHQNNLTLQQMQQLQQQPHEIQNNRASALSNSSKNVLSEDTPKFKHLKNGEHPSSELFQFSSYANHLGNITGVEEYVPENTTNVLSSVFSFGHESEEEEKVKRSEPNKPSQFSLSVSAERDYQKDQKEEKKKRVSFCDPTIHTYSTDEDNKHLYFAEKIPTKSALQAQSLTQIPSCLSHKHTHHLRTSSPLPGHSSAHHQQQHQPVSIIKKHDTTPSNSNTNINSNNGVQEQSQQQEHSQRRVSFNCENTTVDQTSSASAAATNSTTNNINNNTSQNNSSQNNQIVQPRINNINNVDQQLNNHIIFESFAPKQTISNQTLINGFSHQQPQPLFKDQQNPTTTTTFAVDSSKGNQRYSTNVSSQQQQQQMNQPNSISFILQNALRGLNQNVTSEEAVKRNRSISPMNIQKKSDNAPNVVPCINMTNVNNTESSVNTNNCNSKSSNTNTNNQNNQNTFEEARKNLVKRENDLKEIISTSPIKKTTSHEYILCKELLGGNTEQFATRSEMVIGTESGNPKETKPFAIKGLNDESNKEIQANTGLKSQDTYQIKIENNNILGQVNYTNVASQNYCNPVYMPSSSIGQQSSQFSIQSSSIPSIQSVDAAAEFIKDTQLIKNPSYNTNQLQPQAQISSQNLQSICSIIPNSSNYNISNNPHLNQMQTTTNTNPNNFNNIPTIPLFKDTAISYSQFALPLQQQQQQYQQQQQQQSTLPSSKKENITSATSSFASQQSTPPQHSSDQTTLAGSSNLASTDIKLSAIQPLIATSFAFGSHITLSPQESITSIQTSQNYANPININTYNNSNNFNTSNQQFSTNTNSLSSLSNPYNIPPLPLNLAISHNSNNGVYLSNQKGASYQQNLNSSSSDAHANSNSTANTNSSCGTYNLDFYKVSVPSFDVTEKDRCNNRGIVEKNSNISSNPKNDYNLNINAVKINLEAISNSSLRTNKEDALKENSNTDNLSQQANANINSTNLPNANTATINNSSFNQNATMTTMTTTTTTNQNNRQSFDTNLWRNEAELTPSEYFLSFITNNPKPCPKPSFGGEATPANNQNSKINPNGPNKLSTKDSFISIHSHFIPTQAKQAIESHNLENSLDLYQNNFSVSSSMFFTNAHNMSQHQNNHTHNNSSNGQFSAYGVENPKQQQQKSPNRTAKTGTNSLKSSYCSTTSQISKKQYAPNNIIQNNPNSTKNKSYSNYTSSSSHVIQTNDNYSQQQQQQSRVNQLYGQSSLSPSKRINQGSAEASNNLQTKQKRPVFLEYNSVSSLKMPTQTKSDIVKKVSSQLNSRKTSHQSTVKKDVQSLYNITKITSQNHLYTNAINQKIGGAVNHLNNSKECLTQINHLN